MNRKAQYNRDGFIRLPGLLDSDELGAVACRGHPRQRVCWAIKAFTRGAISSRQHPPLKMP
jgi:hypothetical protein